MHAVVHPRRAYPCAADMGVWVGTDHRVGHRVRNLAGPRPHGNMLSAMPGDHLVDPTLLDAVSARLDRSSTAALDASHELLAHYADTGDASTQRAVDILLDRAADALRALADSLADTSRGLQAAAGRAPASQLAAGDVPSPPLPPTGRRRGHLA